MTAKSLAEERLLDVALHEVMADRPAIAAPRTRLLVALLFLCGIGVVATLLWQHRDAVPAPVQEPERAPLPKPVRASSAAELAALPVNTTNLEVRFTDPADLAGLRRFRDLRRLQILAPVASPPLGSSKEANDAFDAQWAAAAARFAVPASFASLGELHTLEVLELPPIEDVAWTPEHFAFLRNLRLVDLGTWCVDLRSRAMIDALLAAPTFRALRLRHARVDADLFRALKPLRLETLELHTCAGLDDGTWKAMADLRSLRALDVTYANYSTQGLGKEMIENAALGDAAFDAFAALELRHLGLDESEFPGDLLARLPVSLQSLDLGQRPMTSGEARTLRRLTGLRDLTFGCGLDEQAAAAVLPSWSLERLDYRGYELGFEQQHPLLDAIAAQPRLADLALSVRGRTILGPLANSPRLRVLLLRSGFTPSDPGIPLAKLEPLTSCKELRTLRLRDCKLDERSVRELFGDRVAIERIDTP